MLSLDQQNKFRELYRRINPAWRPATERFAENVQHRLSPTSLVLDLGCGRGGLIEQIDHPIQNLVGLDPDWTSLSQHRLASFEPPLRRVVGLSEQMPFVNEGFDLIIASWVLEHLAYPLADLKQIRRLLKPGGSFIFLTPNLRHPLIAVNRLSARYASLQSRLVEKLYERKVDDTFPAFYQANTAEDLSRLAASAGLRLAALEHIPDPTYLAFTPALFRISLSIEARLSEARRIHLVGEMQIADQINSLS